VTSSGSFIHLVQWVLQFASVAENERYQFVQSARVAADILRKLSQRRGNQLMASLISHGFEHDRTQYYQLVDRIDLDSYIVKAIVEFRNSFS
jgi:type III secretory pathway lipoprotein EscJ